MKKSSFARKGHWNSLSAPIFVSLSVLTVLLTKVFEKVISPWDEIYHLAYVQYMYNFSLPRLGDEILSWSKFAFSCYPVHSYGMTTTVPCGGDGAANLFPSSGTNTASIWPPIYYFLNSTWVHLFNSNPETALFTARVFSAFIWSLGCGLLCFVLIKRNKFSPVASGSLITIVGVLPMGVFQGAFVTPYSMSPILIALSYWLFSTREKMNTPLLFKLALVSTLSIMAIPQMIAATVFFTLMRLVDIREKFKVIRIQEFIASLLVVASPILMTLIWIKLQSNRRLFISENDLLYSPLTPEGIFGNLFLFIPHSLDGYPFLSPSQGTLSYLFTLIFVAMLLKPFMNSEITFNTRLKVVLVFAISSIFAVVEHFVLKFPIPSRYGIPTVLAAVALSTEVVFSRTWTKVLFVVSILSVVSAMVNPVFGSLQ